MKNILPKMMMAGLAMVILGCSAEDVDEQQMNSLNAVGTSTTEPVADITSSDLAGRWELVSMTSDVAVDFNGDSQTNQNILAETPCFSSMFFEFDVEGNVSTEQARLYFDGTTGNFTCETSGTYKATYVINGSELQVTFTVKGVNYTDGKTISRYNEDGSDYLKVSLTDGEVDSAVYVEDGRQNTVAKNIKKIEFVYVRK